MIKKALKELLFMALLAVATVSMVMYATSSEVWYAGEHTADCNRTDSCGCFEYLTSTEVGK
jgi:hypothetical protein